MKDINNHFTYAYSLGTEVDFSQKLTGDDISTNVLDLKKADIIQSGGKRPTYIVIKVGTTGWTGGGSITIRLQTATADDGTTGAEILSQWTFSNTMGATAGTLLVCQVLPMAVYQRYLAVYFDIETTQGYVEAYLSDAPELPAAAIDQETSILV